ncbi:kinetochore scaffold 1 isoform X3 [Thunnus thynnus]|uniref:kinetochore scaffold 1 isoform X3 n=1 Tax=Thunnus thynnus TaxID=8237 RepID=UPI003527874D
MEPLDPAKTDETGGFTKRRISSILKAPRKSIIFPDPVQQENAVKCAKPVEKRNSRRVSFAAANNVLLFSEDVNNASPAQSQLQELMTTTAATTQNRVQVAVTEDGIQQITGMETLLNAPLHASQQRDKVNFDSGHDFGEKTVMFSTDDAFMDTTHSHTINIANDAELLADFPHQNRTVFSSSGEKTMMFTADDASMDMTQSHTVNMISGPESLSTGRNADISLSSSVPGLDPGFKNFLANLSKPSGSSVNPLIARMVPTAAATVDTNVSSSTHNLDPEFKNFLSNLSKPSEPSGNPVITRMTPTAGASFDATVETNSSLAKMKTRRSEVDKENQAPTSVSSIMEKSQNKPKNIRESSFGGALCPEDDISMDMTEAQTGRIVGFADDDDPFQCLFPTQEMYSRSDRGSKSAENLKTSQQQSSKTQGSSDPKAVVTGNRVQKVITEEGHRHTTDMTSLKNPSLRASRQSMSKVNFGTEDECREKTIRFTADDALMDVTQSHTVNIASGLLAPSNQSLDVFRSCGKMDYASSLEERQGATEKDFNPEFKDFLSNLSKPSEPSVNPVITRMTPTAGASFDATVETNSSLAKMKTRRSEVDKENQAPTSVSSIMEKSQNKPKNIRESSFGGALCPEDDISMDMTEAQTGRIVGFADDDDPFQCLFPTQEMYSRSDRGSKSAENLKTSQQQSSKTQGSSDLKVVTGNRVQKVITEEGRRHTTDMTSLKNPSLRASRQSMSKVNFGTEDECREKTIRFTADDALMDVTQSHTVNIASGLLAPPSQSFDIYSLASLSNPMAPTAVASSKETVDTNSSLAQLKTQRADLGKETRSSGESFNGGTICPEDDISMDMTEAQTGRIIGMMGTDDSLQCLFPTQDTYPPSGNLKRAEATLQQQSSERLGSSNTKGLETSLKASLKTKMQRHPVKFDTQDNGTEKTVRFTVNDAAMDVTQSYTVNIVTDFEPLSHQNVDFLPTGGEKTMRFTANDAAMDVTRSHTINIATDLKPQLDQNVHFLPACGEKTVRFTANDAAMDVTQSHTVNIATDLEPLSHQNVDFLPTGGEKTMRFTASDAAMDVTRSHTVNIATDLEPLSHQNVDFLPTGGEKTMRFTTNDAAMDVTRSHTVNIATDLEPQLDQNVHFLPAGREKTMRFTASDAAMDVTRSHTVNIATDLELQSHQNVDFLPTGGEKTMRFTTNDAAMDVTRSHTVNIATDLVSDSVLSQKQGPNILSTCGNMDFPPVETTVKKRGETSSSRRNRSSSALSLDPGFKNVLSKQSGSWVNPVITKAVATSFQETVDTNGFLGQHKTQKAGVNSENEAPGGVAAIMEKSVNKTTKKGGSSNGNSDHTEDDVSIDIMEAQTGRILGEMCTDEPPQCLSSTQDRYASSDHSKKTDITSQRSKEALEPSNPDGGEITNLPDSPDSNETKTRKKPELRNETSPLSQKLKNSPSAVDHDVDAFPSRKSRRMSLADLQSKARRLSHMINTSPDTVAMDSCTAPLPELDHDLDKTKTKSLPVVEPELEMGLANTEENTQAQCPPQGEQTSTTTTPFKLNTKHLVSRLSMGGFKPKLPQRSKTGHPKKVDSSHVNSMREHTRTKTISAPNQLSNLDNDVSDIYDEELGSFEDLSETLDTRSPQKVTEKVSPSQESNMDEALEDDEFEEDFLSAVQGKKRPLPEDENNTKDEKRIKASVETSVDIVEMGLQSHVTECDGNITTAPSMTTQTMDFSNNTHTTNSKCEATFESTFKHSLFESQLEDYANDVQKKLDDGTITTLEFFKLFNIDFVIHNPRQSVLPGRPNTDRTPMDLLKDRHIIRPKQMVYETDVLNLTEQVEGLKVRMRDLDKPLKIINRPLWEEMRNCSEKEFKSFGAKLKERNNFFRKTSKVQSHEMKEILYTNLVQANREEQQKLRGTIEEADEMIKSLDNCISQLETELAAVEEKGADDKPSLKLLQEGLKQITETMADNERQIAELEMQKKQNSSKLNRLKAETRNFESHIDMLHTVNEWRFGEKRGNCTFYTLLHETLYLHLMYENSNGNDADKETERKISDITFKFQLDDEKSQCHARLVHKLVSQYIEGETAWVEKYPTHGHVRMLLHDVALVVSHCRLLGEEVRLLKMWGGLRLDILDISCVDTQVRIVFSSLKKFSKFEVIFSVSLTGYFYVLQVESFKNIIGSTTIQQIEEIVASFSPARNVLTKTVKKIHDNLLR